MGTCESVDIYTKKSIAVLWKGSEADRSARTVMKSHFHQRSESHTYVNNNKNRDFSSEHCLGVLGRHSCIVTRKLGLIYKTHGLRAPESEKTTRQALYGISRRRTKGHTMVYAMSPGTIES